VLKSDFKFLFFEIFDYPFTKQKLCACDLCDLLLQESSSMTPKCGFVLLSSQKNICKSSKTSPLREKTMSHSSGCGVPFPAWTQHQTASNTPLNKNEL